MKQIRIYLLMLSALLLVACDKNEEFEDDDQTPVQNIRGTGSFLFDDYAPLSDKPITVYYHVPDNVNDFAPIIFTFHGANRDAKENRDDLISKANQNRCIIIAPEFSETNFPGGDAYNLGNVFQDGDRPTAATLNDETVWTFSYIEPLFDHLKVIIGNNNASYHAFGFSAGAQFLHRFLLFKPEARVAKCVAGAAGWYSMPDLTIDFPYGVQVAPIIQGDLDAFFLKDLSVIVGQNDNDPNAPSLRRNPTVDVQGTNRYDRAFYFVNESRNIASSSSSEFDWEVKVVPNAGHDFLPLANYTIDNIILN